ncbi:MAG: hypothetical protein CFH16_00136 [Alphaproteobacteria bacterium MarineAlpha5_Bin6]|nr:MAG: hypothetical protein CFH16_00136 [Alphaproteobacteria bacterium MarineAlpha5_Bin6]
MNNRDWKPKETLKFSPLFLTPFNIKEIFKWLFLYPGQILPWSLFFILLSSVVWIYLSPSLDNTKIFKFNWVAIVFIKNLILITLIWGFIHFRLYVKQKQKNTYKYNHKFPPKKNKNFLFNNQTYDNIFWTLCSAVPIWTAYEVFSLWAFSNNLFLQITFFSNPIYFILLTILIIPIYHEFHFYFIHRLIHWPPLYKYVHYIHHKNTNPGPWSGLAMHPVEHIFYFSGILICFLVPVHPFHVIFFLIRAAVGPALTHSGFDKLFFSKKHIVEAGHYQHYLHHKYFECNYGDIIVPIDQWFGTFHDGSEKSFQKLFGEKNNS